MYFPLAFIALVAPILAAPVRPRAANLDATVFQFAGVLEQLETEFYKQALQKFQPADYQSAGYANGQLPMQLIAGIQVDESAHNDFLAQSLSDLGSAGVTGCNFDFTNALKDVKTFAATARAIENVGVSAYLGGAALITDPQLVDAAATILTIESRHQTVLNILSQTGTSIPQPFDVALNPGEVLSIASAFFSGCSVQGLTANPALTVGNSGPLNSGTKLQLSSPNITGDTSNLSCQILTGGLPIANVQPFDNCTIPQDVNGPVFIWVTSDNDPLQANVVNRDTTKQVAGPALAFVDSSPEAIGQLIGGSSGSSSNSNQNTNSNTNSNQNNGGSNTVSAGTSSTTTTISPDAAESILSSVSSGSPSAPTGSPSNNAATSAPPPVSGSNLLNGNTSLFSQSVTNLINGMMFPAGQALPNSATGQVGPANVLGWTTVSASSLPLPEKENTPSSGQNNAAGSPPSSSSSSASTSSSSSASQPSPSQ